MLGGLTKAVDIVIRGRTENLKRSFGEANTGLEQLASKLVRMRTLAISTFGAYTLVRGIGGVVHAAMDFEKQMAEVHTMLRLGNERYLPEYTKAVQDLSIEFGQATGGITKALYDWLSGLVPPADALKVLRVSLMAAAAGMTDAQTAAEGIIRVIKAYNLEFTEAAHVSDLLWGVVNQGVIRFPELSEEIGKVASTARAAGISLEELMALISTVVQVVEPAKAITALRAAILTVSKPGIAKGIFEVIKALQGAGLTQIQYTGFTRRSSVAMTTFTGNTKSLNDQLNFMQNVMGLTEEAANKMLDTPFRRLNSFVQLMVYLKVVMGKQIMDSLTKATGKLIEMKDSLDSLAKILGSIVARFIKMAAWNPVLTVILGSFVALLPILNGVWTAVTHLGLSFRFLYTAIIRKTTATVADTSATIAATAAQASYNTMVVASRVLLTTQAMSLGKTIPLLTTSAKGWQGLYVQQSTWKEGAKGATKQMGALTLGMSPFYVAAVGLVGVFTLLNNIWKNAAEQMSKLNQETEEFQRIIKSAQGTGIEAQMMVNEQLIEMYTKKLKEQKESLYATGFSSIGGLTPTEFFEGMFVPEGIEAFALNLEKQRKVQIDATQKFITELEKQNKELLKQQNIQGEGKAPIDPAFDMEGYKFRNKKLLADIQDEKDKAITDSFNREMAQMVTKYNQEKESAATQGEDIAALDNKYRWKEYNLRMKYWQKEEEERIKMEERMAEERERINKDSLTSIGELVIRMTKAGLEEQLLLIEYERQEALRKANEIGANLDWINLQYDMLMQRAAQDQLGSTKGGGLNAVGYKAAGLLTRVPGYKDPAQILHKDNEQAKKLSVEQLKVSKEHKDAFNKFLDFLGGNPLLISTLNDFGS